jgi:hypothetical protein
MVIGVLVSECDVEFNMACLWTPSSHVFLAAGIHSAHLYCKLRAAYISTEIHPSSPICLSVLQTKC